MILLLALGLVVGELSPSGASPCGCFIPYCLSNENLEMRDAASPHPIPSWEQELLAGVNRERLLRQLPPLELDETLVRIARDHSRGMAAQGFISHSQPAGDLETRLGLAGYRYAVARENVASARSVAVAHRLLIDSPAHKGNILATDITKVGIGVIRNPVLCDKYLYVTEVFAAPRTQYRPSMVKNLLENRIRELRRQQGGMDPDPLLEKLAARSLLSLGTSYDRSELKNLLRTSASELPGSGGTDWTRLEVSVQLLYNPQNIDVPPSSREGPSGRYGAAVRQITDSRNQPAFLVLTLLGLTR